MFQTPDFFLKKNTKVAKINYFLKNTLAKPSTLSTQVSFGSSEEVI